MMPFARQLYAHALPCLLSMTLWSTATIGLPALAQGQRLSLEFSQASLHDPEYQSAIAQRDGGVESLEQAKAALLPQISSNLQRSQNNTDSRSQTLLGPVDRSFDNYPAMSASLQLRQGLYRPKSWAGLAQSKAQAEYAEQSLAAARQDLGVRLMSTHAEWSAASTALKASRETIEIQARLAAQVQKQFKAGDATRTDVEVAQARLSQARSQFAEAELAFENAKLAWIQMTGLSGLIGLNPQPFSLSARLADHLPLAHANLQRWQEAAREQNPLLRAQRAAISSAKEEVKKAQAEHLPTADLFASRSYSKSAMDNTIGTEYRTAQIGVQVAVPIFAGGAINSIIRQAEANLRRAEHDHLAAINRLNLQIDRDWRSLEAAKVEGTAQRRTIDALQVVIESATRGLSAGIATRQDEDQANLQLLNASRDLGRANARALAAWSRLMASLGALNEANLSEAEAAISKP